MVVNPVLGGAVALAGGVINMGTHWVESMAEHGVISGTGKFFGGMWNSVKNLPSSLGGIVDKIF